MTTTKKPAPSESGIILGWNRDWVTDEEINTHREELEACDNGQTIDGQWSVANRKTITPGTHAFLLAQGNKYPRGIIGHGIVTTTPFEGTRFDDDTKTTMYVGVRWDGFLPFDEPIPVELLAQHAPGLPWRTGIQSSGANIKPNDLTALLNLWNNGAGTTGEEPGPGEVPAGEYWEGAVTVVAVNRYERDRKARQACLDHHGYQCKACDEDLTKKYGHALGQRAIHVHHIIPMATQNKEYKLDPITDLVPLCPNCHNVIHKTDPIMTPAEFRQRIIQTPPAT